MIGCITQPNEFPLDSPNSKIYLLDIRNYTWVDTFPESLTKSSNPSNPSTSSVNNPSTSSVKSPSTSIVNNPSTQTSTTLSATNTSLKVAIGTISGIFGTAILITIGFFGYKRYRRKKLNSRFM